MNNRLIQHWLVYCFIALVVVAASAISIEQFHNKPLRQAILSQQQQYLEHQSHNLLQGIEHAGEELLANAAVLSSLGVSTENTEPVRIILDKIIRAKPNMREITFYSPEGKELVRFDRVQNEIIETPISRLQNKSERFYLASRFSFKNNFAYFSHIDLNEEYGTIDIPNQEVIRFLTTVTDQKSNVIGYLKSKISSEELTSAFFNSSPYKNHTVTFMTSNLGDYIIHPENDRRWGWQLPSNAPQSFDKEFPEAWQHMKRSNSGMLHADQMTFVYQTFGQVMNALMQRGTNVLPIPFDTAQSANLYQAKIGIATSSDLWTEMLIGYSILDWSIAFFIYISFAIALLFFMRRSNDIIELDRLNAVVEETQKNLLTNLGHEIRTPLNGMLGVADLLEANSSRQKRLIQHMRRSIERFISLFSNLATAQRIQQGKIVLHHDSISIKDIAEPLRDMFKLATEMKALEFSIEYDHIVRTRFHGDRYYMQLLISSLLDNAIKFTDRGFVRVSFNYESLGDNQFLIVCVEDSGLGMNSKEINHYKELFIQGQSNPDRENEGLGSGLWIADQLIKLMNGEVKVESTLNEGTKVTIGLPNRPRLKMLEEKADLKTKRNA